MPTPRPLAAPAGASLAIEPRISLAQRPRRTTPLRAQPSSAPPPADNATDLSGEAAWDPEGILPPPPTGSHFARRGEATVASPLAQNLLSKKPAGPTSARLPALGAAAPTPASATPVGGDAIITAPSAGIGAAIDAAFRETFWGATAAPRVLSSFRRLAAGQEHVALHPGQGLQRAESFVEGLTACPFPDPFSGAYPWLEEVKRQYPAIKTEFEAVSATPDALAKGNNVWVPASRKDAVGYGRAWRTLVLQDRGVWDPINSKIFPQTSQIIKDLAAPTLEVFFARQQAGTGITSHTDNANFVQTSHLGLDVPEGKAWIKVGQHTRYWKDGEVITMDTSFMHETKNESEDTDRYVLIMRHWHPELTPLERVATLFLFRSLDEPTPEGIKAAQREATKAMKGLVSAAMGGKGKKGKKANPVASGSGFGKK
jgi:hypothetical protein